MGHMNVFDERLQQVNRRTGKAARGTERQAIESTRAVVYVRASLDQTGERTSVERQAEACSDYCRAKGWTLVQVCEDNSISGYSGKHRPGWEQALELANSGEADVIVAWHLDRITRRMRDLEDLLDFVDKTGVNIATVSGGISLEGDSARLIARILAAVAMAEVERKGKRQKAAHKQRATAGKPWWSHRRPFGYESIRTEEVDKETGKTKVVYVASVHPVEGPALKECYRMKLAGKTYADCARYLCELGLTTTMGAAWTSSRLSRTMRDFRNAGISKYDGEAVAQGTWEPLVSYEQWLQLTDESKATQQSAKLTGVRNGGGVAKSLLGGLMRCEHGERFKQTYAGRNKARIYQSVDHCVSIDAEWMDTYVGQEVRRSASSPAWAMERGQQPGEKEAMAAVAKAATLRDEMDDLVDDLTARRMTREQFFRANATKQAELEELESLSKAFYEGDPLGAAPTLRQLREHWTDGGLSLEQRRAAVSKYVGGITVRPRLNRNERPNADMVTFL